MNIPEFHPTLTLTHPKNGSIIDAVFQYIPMTDVPFWNVDVYVDENYDNNASQKEMTIEQERKWYNKLVKIGYNRKIKTTNYQKVI